MLVPSFRYDIKVAIERAGPADRLHSINAEVLLLGGSKSPEYLKSALSGLEKVIPKVHRIEYRGLDHSAPWNAEKGGKPEVVAGSMRLFFKE